MTAITFSRSETDRIVKLIQHYFNNKLDQEIGAFDAEFLLDFFATEIGSYYYNQALKDVHGMLQNRFDDVADDVFNLEKPVNDR